MRVRKDLIAGLFIGGVFLGAWLFFFGAKPAWADGETCATGSPSPCVEDPVIGGGKGCNFCHSIRIEGGNRNGTDRIITSIVTHIIGRHIDDPPTIDWTSIVNSMIGKGAVVTVDQAAGYLNTNYGANCSTGPCTGPILGSPVQSNVTDSTATVTWSTSANGWEDSQSNTVLFYGKTQADVQNCASSSNPANPQGCSGVNLFVDNTPVGHHVAGLTGLSCNTKYFMVNQATDSTLGSTTSSYAIAFRTKSQGPSCGQPGAAIPARVLVSENESAGSGSENDRIVVIDPNPTIHNATTNTDDPNPNYNKQIGNVEITGTDPADLVAHSDGTEAYGVVGVNLSVFSIDQTGAVNEVASLLGLGGPSNVLAISADGKKLYMGYRAPAGTPRLEVKVFDLTDPVTPVLTTTISDLVLNGCTATLGLGVSPDGTKLYLPCALNSNNTPPDPDRLYLIDTATNTVTQTATFSRTYNTASINAIAVKPDGSAVYLGHGGQSGSGSTVEVFDGSTGANVASIPMPDGSSPTRGVFSPDGSKLFVADNRAGIRVIDPGTNSLLFTMPLATSHGYDIGITKDGNRLYTSLLGSVFANDATLTTGNWIATITGDFSKAFNIAVTPGHGGAVILLPDVVMTAVTPAAASVAPGDTLSVTDTAKNQGTDSTVSGFDIGYVLSPTPNYSDPNAALITTTRFVGPLGVGETDTATTNLVIDSSIPSGIYYVCAQADPTQSLSESNADNNTLCSSSTVQVTKPDLVMTAVSPNAGSVAPGGALSVTDSVQNQGGAPSSGSFLIAYSLSPNSIFGDSDDLAITTTRAVGPLAPGATSTATTNLAMPSTIPPNTYHVCAMADSTNVINEGVNENNNTLCSTATISVSTPDLIMSAVSTTATGAAPGGNFTLSNTAKNVGTGAAGSFTIAFHLSTNQTYGDGDDIPFTTTRAVSSLGIGATNTASTSLTVPATAPLGSYYVCALADSANTVSEGPADGAGENNNALCTSAQLQVTRPDLTMTAVTPNATTVSATATLSVTNSVKNIGGVAAGSSTVGFKLSPTASYDDPAAVASTNTRTVSTLAAGATNTATTTLTLPKTIPPGDYYVCARTDTANTVTELDETNNTLCSSGTVTVPKADLTMTAASTTATVVGVGKTLSLSNTVKNQGLFPTGAFAIAFHLSANTTYGDGDDIAVTATRSLTTLASGASSTGNTSLTVPTSTPFGVYHVCAMADSGGTVNETDETNNSLCTGTTVQVSAADLILTDVSTGATTVNRATAFSVSSTAKNTGALASTAFRIAFHLSPNTTYGDGDDVIITTIRSVTSLAAGSSSTGSTSLTVPSTTPPGTYYVCSLVDSINQVVELDETNNTRCSPTQITVP